MYSVVLMAALTTAPATQGWHCRGGHGFHGHWGGYASCGYLAPNFSYSYGCHGGCYYGCYGCYGFPWYGGGYTSGSFGYPTFQCNGCYGCYGGWSCHGYPTQAAPVDAAPSSMTPEKGPAPKGGKNYEDAPLPPEPKLKKSGQEQARSRVIVDLPADAKLYVDGRLMSATSARRVFQTPILQPGQLYFYELKAEVVRDGQTIMANQRLILRPGQAATASFADLGVRRDATAAAGQQ